MCQCFEKFSDTHEPPAHTVEEVKSKRETDVKHFRMSDGTFIAVTYLPEKSNGDKYILTITANKD